MSDYPKETIKTEIGELEIHVLGAERIRINTSEVYGGGRRTETYVVINRVEYRLDFTYKLDEKTGAFTREDYRLYRKGSYDSRSWTWNALTKAQAICDALANKWAQENPEALGSGEKARLTSEIENAIKDLEVHDNKRTILVSHLENLKASLKATPKSIQVTPLATETHPKDFDFITSDIKPVEVPEAQKDEDAPGAAK